MRFLRKVEEIIKELIEIAKLLNKLFKECLPLVCTLATLWLLIKYGF
jgi:mannose/fructose/N-acetylgalactosamine-specific phosphotransferase system component IID